MAALGVLSLAVGVLLLLVEAHVPTAGVLGAAGTLAVAAGVWMLFASGDVGRAIAIPVTAGVVLVGVGIAAVGGRKAMRARRTPVRAGWQSLIGSPATVRHWSGSGGQVEVAGGLWRAELEFGYDQVPAEGESVVVEQVHGLTLTVRRREPWELS